MSPAPRLLEDLRKRDITLIVAGRPDQNSGVRSIETASGRPASFRLTNEDATCERVHVGLEDDHNEGRERARFDLRCVWCLWWTCYVPMPAIVRSSFVVCTTERKSTKGTKATRARPTRVRRMAQKYMRLANHPPEIEAKAPLKAHLTIDGALRLIAKPKEQDGIPPSDAAAEFAGPRGGLES
jgi:hypothetical protein